MLRDDGDAGIHHVGEGEVIESDECHVPAGAQLLQGTHDAEGDKVLAREDG
jgi:hypothetical protein